MDWVCPECKANNKEELVQCACGYEAKGKVPPKVSPEELGELIYELCARNVTSFLEGIPDGPATTTDKDSARKKADINQIELTIAFMWVNFDFLQDPRFEKALTKMHFCFVRQIKEMSLNEKLVWCILEERYKEYTAAFHSESAPDFKNVAPLICQRILMLDEPSTDTMLESRVSQTLSSYVVHFMKQFSRLEIQD
jgi:hypothetical protein